MFYPLYPLQGAKNGDYVKVAGLVLVRQRPGTASGIVFITVEDETGTANLVVLSQLFDKFRKKIIQSKLIMVEGELQIEGEVIHVIARKCHNFSRLLDHLTASTNEEISIKTSRADETTSPFLAKKPSNDGIHGEIFPDGRNFR